MMTSWRAGWSLGGQGRVDEWGEGRRLGKAKLKEPLGYDDEGESPRPS